MLHGRRLTADEFPDAAARARLLGPRASWRRRSPAVGRVLPLAAARAADGGPRLRLAAGRADRIRGSACQQSPICDRHRCARGSGSRSHGGFPKTAPAFGRQPQRTRSRASPITVPARPPIWRGRWIPWPTPLPRKRRRTHSRTTRVLGLRPRWAAALISCCCSRPWSSAGTGRVRRRGQRQAKASSSSAHDPIAAQVLVDGSDRGATPLTVTLLRGCRMSSRSAPPAASRGSSRW